MLQKPVESLNSFQTNISAKKVYFSNCTNNMLQKACEKFEFLSNNCSAKQVYFFILLYKQYASKSLWKVSILVKQIFGKKDVLLQPILQAICFKKPVESLNTCQTIVRQKRRIFSFYNTGNMLQKACGKF
jgi:hypothetical protein